MEAKTVNNLKALIAERNMMLQEVHQKMQINHVTLRSRLKNPMTLNREESDRLAFILNITTAQMECIIRGLEIEIQ